MRILPRPTRLFACSALLLFTLARPLCSAASEGPGPSSWIDDLSPIGAADWGADRAAHLLERAGFGGTPEEVQRLAAMTPQQAVRHLVHFKAADKGRLPPFDPSGIFDAGLDRFPPSRPATTDLAKASGEALGVKVKPAGNRRMQPVVDKFFYWLRASRLETDRLAYWWANRMLTSSTPLQEKMALFCLHQRLLTYVSDSVAGFMADMERSGRADDVTMMIFSEFGRRVPENTSLGTDHGTANVMFMAGKPVKGGHYGAPPSLTALDAGDNLAHTTDFRRVYATAMQGWLGLRDTRAVLRGEFEPFPMFA